MVETRNARTAQERWSRNFGDAKDTIQEGVESPLRSQSEEAQAAVDRHREATQQALDDNLYGQAVSRLSDGDWSEPMLEIGLDRIRKASTFYADKTGNALEPVIAEIEGVSLDPRGPSGSAANYQRSEDIGTALHEAKVQGRL